ncbi:hypothetical protein L6452_18360 [Arctium lappa]|uniref:Uncharacterized protein n=1 Tax=Arctium lappa TaxID=4217 RepID=A0ACB9C5Z6_ARCLA|nr:hypothetical protein L6452_18360 [Arctium lappa]
METIPSEKDYGDVGGGGNVRDCGGVVHGGCEGLEFTGGKDLQGLKAKGKNSKKCVRGSIMVVSQYG